VYLGVGYCQILHTHIVLVTPFMAVLLAVVFLLFLLVAFGNPGIVTSSNMVEMRLMKRQISRTTSTTAKRERKSRPN